MVNSKKNSGKKNNGHAKGNSMNNAVPSMIVRSRQFDLLVPYTFLTTVSTAPDESQLGVGSRFINVGLDFALRNFIRGSSGIYTSFDQYKFAEIEVMALLDAPVVTGEPTLVVSSVDYDDVVSGDWEMMSQRSNTKLTVLNRYNPYKSIAKFQPRGNFVTTGTDSPSNMIVPPNTWWDMSNPNQLFNGVKISAASQQQVSIRFLARARIEFRGRI